MPDGGENSSTRRKKQIEGLPVVLHNVAGIDLGSEQHWVCAPVAGGISREVADFGATTAELIRMTKWLQACGVKSVAMESTGVYWIAPHEVLEAAGLEVLLVDTRQLARVPGRDKKTDPTDCEWMRWWRNFRSVLTTGWADLSGSPDNFEKLRSLTHSGPQPQI